MLNSSRKNTKNNSTFLQSLIKMIINRKRLIFVLLLTFSFILVPLSTILPSKHTFEGNLIVEEMSFIYNGNQPKTLMESISSINQLEIEGIQTLTFNGEFKSESFSQLNKLKNLKVELIDSKSKLIISQINSNIQSQIDLNQLQLQPNTKVDEFNYDFYRQQIALKVNNGRKVDYKSDKMNLLNVYFGEYPIKISLEKYKIVGLNSPKSSDKQASLEFIYNPGNKESNFNILQNNLYITLQKQPDFKSLKWFKGRIQTRNVKFERLEGKSDIKEKLETSTIVEGKIRLAEQEKEIKANQFLMGKDSNVPLNIELIRNIEIISKKGLEVRFSGRDEKIKIGLDKDFVVTRIQGSWLDGILPRDAIVAIFSFGAAMVANLFSWLLSNASESKSNP